MLTSVVGLDFPGNSTQKLSGTVSTKPGHAELIGREAGIQTVIRSG